MTMRTVRWLADFIAERRKVIAEPIVMASGYFDPIHIGHVRYLKAAAQLGVLIVVVNGDNALRVKRGKKPILMPVAERMEIVDAIQGVAFTVGWDDTTVCGVIEIIRPDIFAKGGDRTDPSNIPEWEVCAAIGCRVATGVGGVKSQSSSTLLDVFAREEWSRSSR